jgi:hypothetical protein
VTEENLRQFLGYNIPRNKKTVTKRGATKKKGDAPPPPRPSTKKRHSEQDEATLEDVPVRKKQNISLATSSAKRTTPRRLPVETITEEGSTSFRGFVPEISPAWGDTTLPPLDLRDETSSKASHQGSNAPPQESNFVESVTTSPKLVKSEGEGELTPLASLVHALPWVKHLAKRKKFSSRDRLANITSEAERM